jgi:hypothetical protein
MLCIGASSSESLVCFSSKYTDKSYAVLKDGFGYQQTAS